MNSNFFKNNSFNLSEILQQNIESYATYSKNWESSNRYLSINISRDQNLTTDENSEVLPQIAFSQGLIYPFRKQTKTRGLSATPESDLSFVEMLGFGYTANFNNTSSKVVDSVQAKSSSTALFSTIKDFQRTNKQSLNQGLSFSISPKLGYFTVSPSLSFSDARTWTNSETPDATTDSLFYYRADRDKISQGILNSGFNVSTRFFGLFQPNVFGITAFRQTVTPTFGLFYNKQIYGDNIPKYSMIGSFDVGNNFEMKYQKGDSAKTENKIQLLNLDANTSYNFAADSMNFIAVEYFLSNRHWTVPQYWWKRKL